jgi:hypothetical protein
MCSSPSKTDPDKASNSPQYLFVQTSKPRLVNTHQTISWFVFRSGAKYHSAGVHALCRNAPLRTIRQQPESQVEFEIQLSLFAMEHNLLFNYRPLSKPQPRIPLIYAN